MLETLRDEPLAHGTPKINAAIDTLNKIANVDSAGVEIKENIVQPKNTTFLKAGKNQFNKGDVLPDSFLNYSTGGTSTLIGYSTSNHFIPVKRNQPVSLTNVRVYVLYDQNKNAYIGENTGSNTAIKENIIPQQDGFMRVTASTSLMDSVMVEYGSEATSYDTYGFLVENLIFDDAQTQELVKKVQDAQQKEDSLIRVVKSGNFFTLTSNLYGEEEIAITFNTATSRNGSLNFMATSINNQQIHYTGDDITPIRTNIATVGANHGYTNVIEITTANHGKTLADLGSLWTDGVTEFVLLKIAGNVLSFGCPYTVDSSGITQSVRVAPVASLTHVSGATNTGSVPIASVASSAQLYPSINNIKVKVMLDGKELTRDGVFLGDNLQIFESYSVMDYKSIIDYAKSNVGKNYATGPVDSLVDLANTFTFRKGLRCTTSHSLLARKKMALGRSGFLQSAQLALSGHTLKRWMPNVKPKSGIDFANGVDMEGYSTSLTYQAADYVDPDIPPNHYVDWLYDSNGQRKHGFAMGYIVDKTNSKNSDRLVNAPTSWDMRSTKKVYPIAYEGTLNLGDYLSFAGFRNYLSPADVKEAILLTEVRDTKETYVYVDLNQNIIIQKELDDELGKNASLVQSKNLLLLNDVVDANGAVARATSQQSNGIIKVS